MKGDADDSNQERLLATRIAHCMPTGIYLECTQNDRCHCNTIEPHSHHQSTFKQMNATVDMSAEGWRRMVIDYRRKDLSDPSDVLPALSGITNRARGLGKYYGGMWGKSLIYDLLWFTGTPNPERQGSTSRIRDGTPSWLWASINGSISFPNLESLSKGYRQDFTVQAVKCTPQGSDPLGKLSSGRLILTGLVVQATFVDYLAHSLDLTTILVPCEPQVYSYLGTLCVEGVGNFLFHPDVGQMEAKELLCFLMFSAQLSETSRHRCYALVLSVQGRREPKPPQLPEYDCLRVGLIATIAIDQFRSKARPAKVYVF